MNNLQDDEEHDDHSSQRDREITLGTTTVLGIFFGLAILCAIFFGFGYSLGSRHSASVVSASADSLNARNYAAAKPSPGSLLNAAPKTLTPPGEAIPLPSVPAPRLAPAPGATAPPEAFDPELPPPPRTPPPPAATPVAAVVPPPTPTLPAAPQSFVVQVSAFSPIHQEDADVIVSTLQHRGYAVTVRNDPNDKLLHIQIGPFATRKDAEVMRQRLLADGFNAYIK